MNSLFIHRCTIRTFTDSTANTYTGEPIKTNSDTTGVKCRFYSPSGKVIRTEAGDVVYSNPLLAVGKSATVSERCHIIGTTGFTGTYEVVKVLPRYDGTGLHHYELILEAIQ